MSSVHDDAAMVPAENLSEKTPTPKSEQLEKHVAVEGTFESQTARYPAPLALFFLLTAICISIFLVALDRTIITTVSDNFPTFTVIADGSHR